MWFWGMHPDVDETFYNQLISSVMLLWNVVKLCGGGGLQLNLGRVSPSYVTFSEGARSLFSSLCHPFSTICGGVS